MGFNALFGTNTNFDPGSTTTIVEDAESIQKTLDYIIIRAAWDEYIELKKTDDSYDHEYVMPTPAWEALSKVIEYGGDLKRFSAAEKSLVHALKNGHILFSDVLHVLIDHHDDEKAGHELFQKYPGLHDVMPEQYDDDLHVIEVIIEVVKDYQWQLEHFAMKHATAIDELYFSL